MKTFTDNTISKSILQFGVGATNSCFDENRQLLNDALKDGWRIIYVDTDISSKMSFEQMVKAHFGKESLNDSQFFNSVHNLSAISEEKGAALKKSFFEFLNGLDAPKRQTLILITFNTTEFDLQEIQKIHEMALSCKRKGFSVIVHMADYGKASTFNENFFGEEGAYDEFWIWNRGEGGAEIEATLQGAHKLPFFEEIPSILKKHLQAESKNDLMGQMKKMLGKPSFRASIPLFFTKNQRFGNGNIVLKRDSWSFKSLKRGN